MSLYCTKKSLKYFVFVTILLFMNHKGSVTSLLSRLIFHVHKTNVLSCVCIHISLFFWSVLFLLESRGVVAASAPWSTGDPSTTKGFHEGVGDHGHRHRILRRFLHQLFHYSAASFGFSEMPNIVIVRGHGNLRLYGTVRTVLKVFWMLKYGQMTFVWAKLSSVQTFLGRSLLTCGSHYATFPTHGLDTSLHLENLLFNTY